jgi:hypothetical protein
MGADKKSSRRRWRLQQDEHGFQHTTPTHYPSWPRPRNQWNATGPRNQQTTFRAKNTPTRTAETCTACCLCCTSQTDGLRRSDRWTAPVRPVATAAAQHAFQRASVTSLGPGTKTPQNTTCKEGKPYTKPNKTTPNGQRTDQQHQDPKTHESSSSPEANPASDSHRSNRSRAQVRPV